MSHWDDAFIQFTVRVDHFTESLTRMQQTILRQTLLTHDDFPSGSITFGPGWERERLEYYIAESIPFASVEYGP